MPRRKRMRRVSKAPDHQGFQVVFPKEQQAISNEPVVLHLEEYESIKLMDYELHSQEEAAEFMQVSRPTITRIYESARRKIAKAFIEGLAIEISGGQVTYDENWMFCNDCNAQFSRATETCCPWCGSKNIKTAQTQENS
ncbi:MAG: DUF134 domain-containing protein [Bacteroidales bacterium]|jgi:predicted DNA-binding protein (UPF0251 family)|nr:DUF134 domain-containing protein [Bacteroidales bacterium]